MFLIGGTALLLIIINLLMIGHKTGQPIIGARKWIIRGTFKFSISMLSLVCTFTHLGHKYLSMEQVNYY